MNPTPKRKVARWNRAGGTNFPKKLEPRLPQMRFVPQIFLESVARAVNTCRRQHENFSTSIQRRKRGKRTAYIARLTYYDKTGKRKGGAKSAPPRWDAKRELQDLIDQHVAGGSEVLEARNIRWRASQAALDFLRRRLL